MSNRSEICELMNMCMLSDENGNVLAEYKVCSDIEGFIFPGGHVEKGESVTGSVIREMYEETGLTVENPTLCGVKQWLNSDGSRGIVFLYKADKYHGESKSSKEGVVSWIPLDEFKKKKSLWYMHETLEVFLNDNLNELFQSETGENAVIKLI